MVLKRFTVGVICWVLIIKNYISFYLRFWFFKFATAVAIIVGAFFIPEGTFTTGKDFFFLIL